MFVPFMRASSVRRRRGRAGSSSSDGNVDFLGSSDALEAVEDGRLLA